MGRRGPKPKNPPTFDGLMRKALAIRCSPTADIEAIERADAALARWMADNHIVRVKLATPSQPTVTEGHS